MNEDLLLMAEENLAITKNRVTIKINVLGIGCL